MKNSKSTIPLKMRSEMSMDKIGCNVFIKNRENSQVLFLYEQDPELAKVISNFFMK
jgi:hypothetical protein